MSKYNKNTTVYNFDKNLKKKHSTTIPDKPTTTEQPSSKFYINEDQLLLVMQATNDGLWDWHLETDEVYYSPCWKSMFGYKEDELDNNISAWASIVYPDDKDRVLEKAYDYIEGRADSFSTEMRMNHKDGHTIFILARAFLVTRETDGKPIRLVGTHVDITKQKKAKIFGDQNAHILEMIATGVTSSSEIYDAIALMYEGRYPEMRCSMVELHGDKLMHARAPSLPQEFADAINGTTFGPNVACCGTSTFTGKDVIIEDIETHPNWEGLKHITQKLGLRSCWSSPVKSTSGTVLGSFGMFLDHPGLPSDEQLYDLHSAARLAGIVIERDRAQKRIHALAFSDEITGLASRAHFYQKLEESIKISDRYDRRFALLYIDLDNFKSINDSLGHDAGDTLLRSIAKRLESTIRDIDYIARIGGDEFCILVEEVGDDCAAKVAKRCLESTAAPIEISSRKFTPMCSIGIAHYPDDGQDSATLMKTADTSLYEAKENGKNQYAFYNRDLTRKAEYRFQVEHYLREAIKHHQLSLVYQPQVDVQTGKIIGVEALSRWNHPELGQVPPTDFIATAERIGMIKPLTEWALDTACRQAVAWKKQGFPALQMSVNISPVHFLNKDIVSLIERMIDETGIAPEELSLEVTETVVQTKKENLAIIRDLKNIGVQLAIDDFGTGYSSLASLKHLEVDCLKIDKYFVDEMLVDKKGFVLINSMVEMGHKLGYKIVAEGVETFEQLEILKSIGCETIQGYLYSKPVSAYEISKFLSTNFEIHPPKPDLINC